jgi:hypothetical protein
LAVNRLLGADMMVAEGPVLVNSASQDGCGGAGVAPLQMRSRSAASSDVLDTLVVWRLAGADLVRTMCIGVQTESRVVASGISTFAPAACAAQCIARTISVRFAAKGSGAIVEQEWTLTVSRRGGTS